MYKVVISKKALKELEQLPRNIIAKFREKFIALAQSPYQNSSVKKLVNPKSLGIDLEEVYRVRVGDYRAIYSIKNDILTIHILKIAHRKNAY